MSWILRRAAFFSLGVAAMGLPPFSVGASESLVVHVSVNGGDKGDFFAIRKDDGSFFFRTEDIAAMDLVVPEAAPIYFDGGRYLSPCAVQGVSCSFDEKNVALSITAPSSLLPGKKTVVELIAPQRSDVYYPNEKSVFLNYGFTYSHEDALGFQSLAAAEKLGIRSGPLLVLTDSLYTKTQTRSDFVRLMSSVTYERRPELQWLTVGDSFASSGELGSTVNMGGVSFSKVYRMDPQFIKQPTMTLSGAAAFPSQAEVYMDGRIVSSYKIQPGTFDLHDFYYPVGAHDVELVIKDAFGNEQRIEYPSYFSDLLLKRGIHEYSYSAGFLREQYGIVSNEYGKSAFSGYHRYGLGNSLTIGARAETTAGLVNGGIQSAFAFPEFGAFAVSLSESRFADRSGAAGALLHVYQRQNFNTNLLLRGYTRDYTTIGSLGLPGAIRYEGSLAVSYGVPAWGAISLGYSVLARYSDATAAQKIPSVTVSKPISRFGFLTVTARAVMSAGTDYEVFIGYSYTAREPAVAVSVQSSRNEDIQSVQAYNRIPVGEGVGYRASLTRSASDTQTTYLFNPFIQYNAPFGIYAVDSRLQSEDNGGSSNSYTVSASGAFVYVDGFFGVSRPVNDSFSVVMVDALKDVAVSANNEKIGTTGSSGTVIIPTIQSYYHNQITVDADNVPFEYTLRGINTKISPSQWSGSCVSFEAHKVQAITGMLSIMRRDGKAPLEYQEVTMKAGDQEVKFLTGSGGEFYLENTIQERSRSGSADSHDCRSIFERRKSGGKVIKPGTYRASVDYEGGTCEFFITFPETEDVMSDLGTIQCILIGSQ